MPITRPTFASRITPLITALSLAMLAAGPALAQAWPGKPITIVVPTAAGGANDAMARILAQGLSTRLGKPVIVENKSGANGAIASEFVARAASDGYTIMFGYIATHGINPVSQPVHGFSANPGRQTPGPGHCGRQTFVRPAGCAHTGRAGHQQRQHVAVVRPVCPGKNSQGRGRPAEPRTGQRAGRQGGAEKDRGPGCRG